ncbi:MAG: Rieske (2Fe-2S) protein [candidate division KSB1 bacterium]|nr:Rieske (2Fe-2S) protein [candidate division KSB1 bacterium]MDZ7304848.1 Rieske (2Fe-2S) protein [candidate division KSB1 bacterium]MDZ7314421.1 Rieske (2Fe-2S) protein [candidate division KSB1 bacterium]
MKKKHVRTQQPEIDRRTFLTALGWAGVGFSGLIAGIGNLLYLKPAVNYGPATNFRAGKPEDFKEGIKEIFENERVVLVREKKGFAAISLTCTHLGCTIRTSEAGFECPCHGSQFDNDGYVTGGPAPRPLDWYQVSLAPNGELEVDKSVKVAPGTYFTV